MLLPTIFDDSFRVNFLHFLQPNFIYEAVNLITLRLRYDIDSLYTDNILK